VSAASAYNAIAGRYEALEHENRILALMRRRSLAALLQALPERARLLELGAGAGEEAAAVAGGRRASVVAVEPAPALAAIAEAKARARAVTVEVVVSTASQALASFGESGAVFGGAWSSFAIGYDAPLPALRAPLAAVLSSAAPFVVSLRNPWCLAEPWSIPSRATGRYRHKVGDARVAVAHYSPRAAVRALAPDFSLERSEALPALVPPPRYGRAWNCLGGVARGLERADEKLAARAPFRALGDHTLMVFRRH